MVYGPVTEKDLENDYSGITNDDSNEIKKSNEKCYDCGSTIPGHHTKLCDFAEKDDIRDLPAQEGTQWWTGEVKKKNCDKIGISEYCCNTDIRLVQMRSQTAGGTRTNEFKGEKVYMCKECRKCNCGDFKFK